MAVQPAPPKRRRERKLEDKFGVTSSYPQLSLHSAAANGNVGLVKYALSNGQPASSVLNGVLPIHAACSNGNEAIVRMLIENGADVNAPRLPRRYTNEKRTEGVSVGTSGSTPLHFAAANGHAGIVELLLACGARPDLTEKHGHTPEAVAQSHGHSDIVNILQNWDADGSRAAMEADAELETADSPPPNAETRSILSSSSSFTTRQPKRRGSTPSLRSFTGSASGVNVGRAGALPLPSPAGPKDAATYSALTLQPNTSSVSLSFLDKRRPSLSAVLDRAAYQGAVLKQALGMNSSLNNLQLPPRPAPLTLTESNSDAFEEGLTRRPSSATVRTRSPFNIFHRKRPSPSPSTIADSNTTTPNANELNSAQDYLASRRYISEDNATVPQVIEERPIRPATAPPERSSFSLSPPSLSISPSPPSSSHLGKRTPSYNNLGASYRPRKSSSLLAAPTVPDTSDTASSAGSDLFHDAPEDTEFESAVEEQKAARVERPTPRHHRTSSASSDRTQTSREGKRKSPRHTPELSITPRSPPIMEEIPEQSILEHSGAENNGPERSEKDEFQEQGDTVANIGLPYRSRSHSGTGSRLRANSFGSSGSAASRYSALSPYAVMAPSPLASSNNSSERLQLSPGTRGEWEFPLYPRSRRSGSTSTEPDLRHVVLSSHSSTTGNDGPVSSSPTSSSSWGSFKRPSSAHSTSATSFVPSSASIRDPPASPRKFGQAIITPSMAHSMVVQAEKQLLAFNEDDSASKPSLSDQLAAYSDSLSLEREVVQQGRPRYIELPPGTHRPYHYERLDPTGTRTPIADPANFGRPTSVKAYPYKPKASFQQGVLDVRRPQLPKLRQDKHAIHKLPIPQSASLPAKVSEGRSSRTKDKERMVVSSGESRASASTVSVSEDEHSKTESSRADSSPPPSLLLDVPKQRKPSAANHRHTRSSPTAPPFEEPPNLLHLTTPLAPRTSGYDSATGIEGLGLGFSSARKPSSRLARALGNMKL